MTPEKARCRDCVAKFNAGFRLQKFFSSTGKYYKISSDYCLVPRFFLVSKSFQISPDFQNLVECFTIWQHCCWVFQCLVNKLFIFSHIMPIIRNVFQPLGDINEPTVMLSCSDKYFLLVVQSRGDNQLYLCFRKHAFSADWVGQIYASLMRGHV